METRTFSGAGLTARASAPESSSPNPSGQRKRLPEPDRARSAARNFPGFLKGMRPQEAVPLLHRQVAAADVGGRRSRWHGGSAARFQVQPAARIAPPCRQPFPGPELSEQGGREAPPERPEGPGTRKYAAADWRIHAGEEAGEEWSGKTAFAGQPVVCTTGPYLYTDTGFRPTRLCARAETMFESSDIVPPHLKRLTECDPDPTRLQPLLRTVEVAHNHFRCVLPRPRANPSREDRGSHRAAGRRWGADVAVVRGSAPLGALVDRHEGDDEPPSVAPASPGDPNAEVHRKPVHEHGEVGVQRRRACRAYGNCQGRLHGRRAYRVPAELGR